MTCVCFISFSRTWAREALKSEKTSPGAVCSVPGFTSMIKSCVQRAKVHFSHRASGSYQDRFGHGEHVFGAREGHTGNFEQGFGAMGRPKSKMLIFQLFYKVFACFEGSIWNTEGAICPQEGS